MEFRLVPIFFTVGVNEQAILADKFGDMTAVMDTNQQSFVRLESYHRRYQKLMTDFFPAKSWFSAFLNNSWSTWVIWFNHFLKNLLSTELNESKRTLSSIITQLQTELMATDKIQNIEIHHLAETAVRKMRGKACIINQDAKE